MKNRILVISCAWCIALLCLFGEAKSQNREYSAELPEISASGFYKIALSPALISKTGSKFNRIRVYDGKSEIPYLIKKYPLSTTIARFHRLPILEKIRQDSLESIMFGNPDSVKLTNVQVTIKRAWASKKIKVSGSSDGKIWYVVRSQFLMNLADGVANNNEVNINYTLDLPLTNYKFYKIECNNKDDLAVNILSIGYFSDDKTLASPIQLPQPDIEIIKTKDLSTNLFSITFHEAYLINRLVFTIGRPHLFHRNARLYRQSPLKDSTRKQMHDKLNKVPFTNFILSSKDSLNAIELDDVYSKRLFVLVENQNNPSLDIKAVRGYYHPYYIKIYLEKGKNYALHIGSESLLSPVYDLSNFDNSSDDQIQELVPKTLIERQITATAPPKPFFENKIWLNAGLLFVALILAYVCMRMIQDMKK